MAYWNDPMGAALDRHITGNWGEDSVQSDFDCEKCPYLERCEVYDKPYDPDNPCLWERMIEKELRQVAIEERASLIWTRQMRVGYCNIRNMIPGLAKAKLLIRAENQLRREGLI